MPNELQTATVFTAAPNDNREYWESFKKLRDNYETGKYNSKYLIKGGVLKTSSPTGILDHKLDEHVMAKPRLTSSDDKSAKKPAKKSDAESEKTGVGILDTPLQAEFQQSYNPHNGVGRPVFTPVRSKQMTIEEYFKIINKNQEKERFETVIDKGRYNPPVVFSEAKLIKMMQLKKKPMIVPAKVNKTRKTKNKK